MTSKPEMIEMPHGKPIEVEVAKDDEKRRQEFAIRLVELADDFDDLDHAQSENGMSSDLQDDCQKVRELARSIPKPESVDSEMPALKYVEPEGKREIAGIDPPEFNSVEEEANWHRENLAYRLVLNEDGWDKDRLLDAVEDGSVDVFGVESHFEFPPGSGDWSKTFFALRFDDREVGQRIANAVLEGFNRGPRPAGS